MPVTPVVTKSITPPAPGVPGPDPHEHTLNSNVYAAQAPKPNGLEDAPTAQDRSPDPPPAAKHEIEEQHARDEKEHHDAEVKAKSEAKSEAQAKSEGKAEGKAAQPPAAAPASAPAPAPAPALSVPDTLTFAIFDLERGINQLRLNSAASVPGTWVHTAIAYFDSAVARLDRSLGVQRHGQKLSEEDRIKERTRYEKEYMDPAGVERVNM